MKILFINSHRYDYLQDICYSGLTKLLGTDGIKHWPPNPRFILPLKRYPRNLGFHPRGLLNAALTLPDAKCYDVVIIGSCRPDAFRSFLKIARRIPYSSPVIFLDGGDRPEVGGDLDRLGAGFLLQEALSIRDFTVVFKREYIENSNYPKNVRPLPFGFNFGRLPRKGSHSEKKYNVTFWAVESHPIRTAVLRRVEGEFDCSTNGTKLNQRYHDYKLRGKGYLRELASSKIALNFRGGGWDTLRYWEIPSSGSFMISQKPKILIPNNFNANEHVAFCNDDLRDLLDLCKYYLRHEHERESMALAAQEHARKYHSELSRAETILRETMNVLKMPDHLIEENA